MTGSRRVVRKLDRLLDPDRDMAVDRRLSVRWREIRDGGKHLPERADELLADAEGVVVFRSVAALAEAEVGESSAVVAGTARDGGDVLEDAEPHLPRVSGEAWVDGDHGLPVAQLTHRAADGSAGKVEFVVWLRGSARMADSGVVLAVLTADVGELLAVIAADPDDDRDVDDPGLVVWALNEVFATSGISGADIEDGNPTAPSSPMPEGA